LIYVLARPSTLFDRELEWTELSDFVTDRGTENRLAIVLGRRRQGKSMLIRHIVEATNGFYFEAAQQTSAQNLADFSDSWNRTYGGDSRSFSTWRSVVEHLGNLAPSNTSRVIALDEVGYLIDSAPELPSLLQRLFTEQSAGGLRVILCGSAFAQMRRLLAPSAPLRGRQHRTLQVDPFGYRTAASFWGLDANPDAAFRLHALIGGTPAYRRFTTNSPLQSGNIDDFITKFVLEPSSVLYGEGRAVVADDKSLADKALYWAVLNAVADGASRRSEIADVLDRPDSALHVPIETLVAAALIEKRPDPFNRRATTFSLAEPMLRTERILIAPERARIERGRALAVWEDAQPRIARRILGPHLEWMAAEWLLSFASAETAGGEIRSAGPGVFVRSGVRSQLDVVAVAPDQNDVDRICLIGECKAGSEPVGRDELDRLDTIAVDLGKRSAPTVKRLLVARSGFTAELRRLARNRPDVELADLRRLYQGD
jgi:uncharacterized protein